MKSFLIAALVLCAGILGYMAKKRRDVVTLADVERKTVEGELSFNNVAAWFKTLHLNKETDTPFIANAKEKDCLKNKMNITLNLQLTPGKESLLLGVYSEKEERIIHSCLIEANSFDAKTREVLSNEPFVILS